MLYWRSIMRSVFLVGGICLWLGVLATPIQAASGYTIAPHSGEELYDQALLGVELSGDEVLLMFGRPEPGLLAPNFTMSYCGKELAPSIDNLRSMIGRSCRSWALGKRKTMLYHRLEFLCR